MCVLGRILEERCVCVAIGKEGSCSFNSRASRCPQNLEVFVFYFFLFLNMTLGLFKVCREEGALFFNFFYFFGLNSGQAFKFIALLALQMALFWDLRTVTSANGIFLGPTLTH